MFQPVQEALEPMADAVRRGERASALLAAAPDAQITLDAQGRVLDFSPAAERIFGYRREQLVGRALLECVVPPRLLAQAHAALAGYATSGESTYLGRRFETFARRADGSEFPVEVALAVLSPGGAPLLALYVSDATARKHAEREAHLHQERLRALTADLLLAEERERHRLALDLHDGLSQTIALTRIKLSALRHAKPRELERALVEIEALVDETNRTVRSVGFELSPPILHDLGLVPAVQWLVETIQVRYGIEITLEDDGQPKPADEKTRVILFRSVRELLINAAKHAQAKRVRVCLAREGERVQATVEDDGSGMEPDVVAARGSGLFSIRERVSHVGGSMLIDAAPGRGTSIRLCAPLTSVSPKASVKT